MIDFLPKRLLRRHVGHGPQGRARFRELRPPGQFGQAEIHDLDPPLLGDYDICGLDIPVDDRLMMGLTQSFGDLKGDIDDLV